MRYLLFLSVVFMFLGCVDKQKVGYFDDGRTKQKALINTSKQEFNFEGKRYLVAATYLNPIKKSNISQDEENFILNIYANNNNLHSLITGVSLNKSIEGIEWKALDINSSLAKFSPTYNKWSKYFLIKAPLKDTPKLNLLIEIGNSKRVQLNFLKNILG